MKTNQFAVYQVKAGAETKDLRFRSYAYAIEHKVSITVKYYEQAYLSVLLPTDTPDVVWQRLKKQPKALRGHSIGVSDVLVFNQNGVVISYYIDKTQLVVLAGFIRTNSSGSLVTIDTEGFQVEGRSGTWMATDETHVDGKHFFLMESEKYRENAEFVVVDEQGKFVCESCSGFDDAALRQIRDYLNPPVPPQPTAPPMQKPPMENWQKYYENGEYLRAAEITEEQNYNMIDGRVNNLPAPRVIGGRVSVLDRLKIKQAGIALKNGKAGPDLAMAENMERNRK
ncbi:MAG: YodL domain-containing protein [Lachnospiraceae bacterium]|nr:YodL domain-containing protein [Lachnospiraceae bacterium]